MLQVNIQFLVKNSLQIEYTPHQIPGFVFRQWTWKKTGSLEWRKSFIRVVCFSFISLLQKRRKIRHQGMKNLKSSNQGFKCMLDTTIKASSCSRHSLSWLPSSQWFCKCRLCPTDSTPHLGELLILFMCWMGGDIWLYSSPHLPEGRAYGTRRVNHTTPFWPLWLV